MFDTMTMTKAVSAFCGALLLFLLANWASDIVYARGQYAESGDGHGGEAVQAYSIDTGVEEAPAEGEGEVVDVAVLLASADAAAGEKVFAKCKACHKLDGTDGTGPHLNGIVDRAKAAAPGFAYSEGALAQAGDVWSSDNLFAFLENPKGYMPGTKMNFAGLPRAEERANLISYLAANP
jgi:cytochrome c